MSCWLPPMRRHCDEEGTMGEITPPTHGAPVLNDLDPNDETVVALTSASEGMPLPDIPEGARG